MDIISHAIAGGVTGYHFGHPVLGAFVGVAPDLVLGIKRRQSPNLLYVIAHSAIPLIVLFLIGQFTGIWFLLWCYASHIYLDVFTHSEAWSPKLLFPFSRAGLDNYEWEWFNSSWILGFFLNLVWIWVWLWLF